MNACAGKLLTVDLTDKTWSSHALSEASLRSYFLGSGMAARLFMDFIGAHGVADALSPQAPLYIMTGLLTGTLAPSACRVLFCGRSPLTGIWNESTAGGYLGAELRAAGWDGVVITGRSSEPIALSINDDGAEFLPAGHLWGQETLDAGAALRGMTDDKAQTAVIGPAGEKLIPMANVMLGGHDSRTAGRGGMGAVMGAKNLKGIAVRGHSRPGYVDPGRMRAIVKEANAAMRDAYVGMSKLGTGGGLTAAAQGGDMPVRNWAGGDWVEKASKLSTAAMADMGLLTKSYRCFGCPVGCTQGIRIPSGPFAGNDAHAPEYETLAGFGGNCLNEDLTTIITANERCNRLGIDTISTSAAIAFAMEAAEKGLIDAGRACGLDLSWGNGETILALVEQIGAGEGFGALLGKGVRIAAQEIGGGAAAFAPHVKGLELPYHDPRAETSMAGNYATGNRGACHLSAITYAAMRGTVITGLYMPEDYAPDSNEGKGRMAAEWQDFMSAINALGICKLVSKTIIDPPFTAELLRAAFGWDMTAGEVVEVGERIFNLQRLINNRFGVTRDDDVLVDRFTREPRPDGGAAGVLPDMDVIMADYYRTRGWDEVGRPGKAKLEALGLV